MRSFIFFQDHCSSPEKNGLWREGQEQNQGDVRRMLQQPRWLGPGQVVTSKGERSKMPTNTENHQDLLAVVNQEKGGEEKKT